MDRSTYNTYTIVQNTHQASGPWYDCRVCLINVVQLRHIVRKKYIYKKFSIPVLNLLIYTLQKCENKIKIKIKINLVQKLYVTEYVTS